MIPDCCKDHDVRITTTPTMHLAQLVCYTCKRPKSRPFKWLRWLTQETLKQAKNELRLHNFKYEQSLKQKNVTI